MGILDMMNEANKKKEREELLRQHETAEQMYDMLWEASKQLWTDSEEIKKAKQNHKEKAKIEFKQYFTEQGFEISEGSSILSATNGNLTIELDVNNNQCDINVRAPYIRRNYDITLEGYGYATTQQPVLRREFDPTWKNVSISIDNDKIKERIEKIKTSTEIVQKHNANLTENTLLKYEDGRNSFRTFTELLKHHFDD